MAGIKLKNIHKTYQVDVWRASGLQNNGGRAEDN